MDFVRVHRPVILSLVAGKGHYESVVKAAMNAERVAAGTIVTLPNASWYCSETRAFGFTAAVR